MNVKFKVQTVLYIMLVALFFILFVPFSTGVEARRTTPEDIVNSKKVDYEEKVGQFSLINQQRLQSLEKKIAELNKKKTDDLERIMIIQSQILDEFEVRSGEKNQEGIEKARYWITYAHEAVAYQAAKIYVFNLTTEGNLKNDALSTVSVFQSEFNSTRDKVINSQKFLRNLVSSR